VLRVTTDPSLGGVPLGVGFPLDHAVDFNSRHRGGVVRTLDGDLDLMRSTLAGCDAAVSVVDTSCSTAGASTTAHACATCRSSATS